MVDLKRLGHLVALADECHFARAAQRVHLSQPAFSRSIQSIEDDFGMRLFDRDNGPVRPTPAGEFLVERARKLLFEARSLRRDATLYRDNQLGDTAFGAGPYPAATLMPKALAELRRRYPSIGLRLEMSNWQLLLQRLLAEDIEFFVADVRDIPPNPRLQTSPIGRLAARLYVRAAHPLAGQRCSLAEAWGYGVATTRMPSPVKALIGRLIGLAGDEEVVPAIECDDVPLLRTLALSTDSLAALPDAAVREDLRNGTLALVDVTDLPPVYSEMGVVMLANRTPSPMAQRALECVREVSAALTA